MFCTRLHQRSSPLSTRWPSSTERYLVLPSFYVLRRAVAGGGVSMARRRFPAVATLQRRQSPAHFFFFFLFRFIFFLFQWTNAVDCGQKFEWKRRPHFSYVLSSFFKNGVEFKNRTVAVDCQSKKKGCRVFFLLSGFLPFSFYRVLLNLNRIFWISPGLIGFFCASPSSIGFIEFYRVLLSFVGLYDCYCVLLGFPRSFTVFYWLLQGFTGFYWVILGFTRLYWVLLGSTWFYRVLLGFTGFYWVLLGYTGLYWVLLGFTGLYWVLLGFLRIGSRLRLVGGCIAVFIEFNWFFHE